MSWLRKAVHLWTGQAARDRAFAQQALLDTARQIIAGHEARPRFCAEAVLTELKAKVPADIAEAEWDAHKYSKIMPLIAAGLDGGLLSPDEYAKIASALARYGYPRLGELTRSKLDAACIQYPAWNEPLNPIESPLLLRRNEWCVDGIQATAYQERQRTRQINHAEPADAVKIMKGVDGRHGSPKVTWQIEFYLHAFGSGVLCATNQRLLWASPGKTITIPLGKITMFEPSCDRIKIFKDTGRPILFAFDDGENLPALARISRAIEELR